MSLKKWTFRDTVLSWLETLWTFIVIAGFALGPFVILRYLGPLVSLIGTPLLSIAWYYALYGNPRGYVLIRLPLFLGGLGCHAAALVAAIGEIIGA